MKFKSYFALFLSTFVGACSQPPPPPVAPIAVKEVKETTEVAAPIEIPEDDDAPAIPPGAIVHPAFDTTAGMYSAGTAFIVAIPGYSSPLVVTAHHLFGPAGDLPREVKAQELGQFVRNAYYIEAGRPGSERQLAGPMVVLPSAGHPQKPTDRSMDVAAFQAPSNLAPRALPLAGRNATVGDDVWLVAHVFKGKSAGKRLHKARVLTSEAHLLVVQFEDSTLELRTTSGAPIVNGKGEVIGMILGGGAEGNALQGFGNPVENINAHLLQGLAKETTCEAALAKYVENRRPADGPPNVTAGSQAPLLNKGSYLMTCKAPNSMIVKVCTAVQNGQALGVTVTTSPPDWTIASCVADEVRKLPFAARPPFDTSRTTFE